MAAGACAPKLPTPSAPTGKGWYTNAQGYHQFTQSQSTQRVGNTQVTTTTMTSAYSNAQHHEKRSAEDVTRKLVVGRNVSEYDLNPELKKEVAR